MSNIINNLIASGGGIKVIGLIGSLNALHDNKLLHTINNYIGCSASSVILLLIILKYELEEVFALAKKCTENIIDNENSILNLIQDGGIGKGIEYTSLIDNIIEKKTKIKYCTFKDLYKISQKNLTLCITDLNSGKAIYMNHQNYPNFIVSEAIRVSCGLPFLLTPSIYYKVCITTKHNNDTNKIIKKRYYYLCGDYENYIGISNKTHKLTITKNKNILKKPLFTINYISSPSNMFMMKDNSMNKQPIKKWLITSHHKNKNIKFNEKSINYKSTIITPNSKLFFNENLYVDFQKTMVFADGAILDVFPIHLSNKFIGRTLGITYEYEKHNDNYENDTGTIVDDNILNYIIRIKEITVDNNYWTKTNKYKSLYVVVDIPRHVGMCQFDIDDTNIDRIIKNGYDNTTNYITKNGYL